MTGYILEGFNIEFNREEKKVVFSDKDKNSILIIDNLKDCLLIGNLILDFFTDVYFEEVAE